MDCQRSRSVYVCERQLLCKLCFTECFLRHLERTYMPQLERFSVGVSKELTWIGPPLDQMT